MSFILKRSGEGRPSSWKRALWLTLSLRIIYSTFAAVSVLLQPVNWRLVRSNALTEALPAPVHDFRFLLLGVWERFDTLWYLHIAARGYDLPSSVVFFPFYPSLIKVLSLGLNSVASALLISTVSAFFVFWGLQLLSEDMPAQVVISGLTLFSVWPASFILFAAYAESLLLALILWSWIMARTDRWGMAIPLAFGASVTKAVGVVVIVPLIVVALRKKKLMVVPSLFVILAPVAYVVYLHLTGRPAIDTAYAQYWRTVTEPPWTTLWQAAGTLVHSPNPILIANFLMLGCVCLLVGFSRMGIEFRMYAVCVICLLLCKVTAPPLQSMMRYVLIIFPAFTGAAYKLLSSNLRSRFGLICVFLFLLNLGLLWLFVGWSLIV